MNQDTAARGSKRSRLIVVLGMHRSGTSAITRGLTTLGVCLGDRLMAPNDRENPSGFWEDTDIYQLNVEILRALGKEWHCLAPLEPDFPEVLRQRDLHLRALDLLRNKLSTAQIFGFKDPRITVLLPFWREVFAQIDADVSYLLVVRNPISVIKSLIERNQFDEQKSALLWLKYCVSMLEGSVDAHSRVLVEYDVLMQSPETELHRISAALTLTVDQVAIDVYRTQFLNHALRHAAYKPADVALSALPASSVQNLYLTLHEVAIGNLTLDAPAVFGQIERSRQDLSHWGYPLRLIDRLNELKTMGDGEIAARDARLDELEARQKSVELHFQLERERRETCESIITTLKETASEKDRQLVALKASLSGSQLEVAQLKQTASISDQRASDLTGELGSLKTVIADKDAQLQMRLEDVERGKAEINSLQRSLASSEHRVSNLSSQAESLKAVLLEKDARIQIMDRHLVERKTTVETLTQAMGASEMRISTLVAEKESLETALGGANARIQIVSVDLEDRRAEVTRLKQALSASKLRASNLFAERERLKAIIAERDSQLATQCHKTSIQEVRFRELSFNFIRLEERCSLSVSQIYSLEAEAESLRAAMRREVQKGKTYRAQAEEFANLVCDRDQHIASMQTELGATLGMLDKLDKAAAERTVQLRASLEAQRDLGLHLIKARDLAAGLEAERNSLRISLSQTSEELRFRDRSAAEMRARLGRIEPAVCKLQRTVERVLDPLARDSSRVYSAKVTASTLSQLLDLDGAAFIETAYRLLLLRTPDAEGQTYYQARIRSGVPKMQVLCELAGSKEGSKIQACLPGLRSAIRRQRLIEVPVFGRFFAWALNADDMSPFQKRVRVVQQLLEEVVQSFRIGLEDINTDVLSLCEAAVQADGVLEDVAPLTSFPAACNPSGNSQHESFQST